MSCVLSPEPTGPSTPFSESNMTSAPRHLYLLGAITENALSPPIQLHSWLLKPWIKLWGRFCAAAFTPSCSMSGCTAGFSSRVPRQEKACSGLVSSFTPRNSSWQPDTWGRPGHSHSPVLAWLFSTQSTQNLHTDPKHSQLLHLFQKRHVSCLRSSCAESLDLITLDPMNPALAGATFKDTTPGTTS